MDESGYSWAVIGTRVCVGVPSNVKIKKTSEETPSPCTSGANQIRKRPNTISKQMHYMKKAKFINDSEVNFSTPLTNNANGAESRVPRNFSMSYSDKISIIFSSYFDEFIRDQPIQTKMNNINWSLGTESANVQALFPPSITTMDVFESPIDKLAESVLSSWENKDKNEIRSQMIRFLNNARIFRIVHNALSPDSEIISNLEDFTDCFSHVWFTCSVANILQNAKGPVTCGFQHVYIGELKRVIKGLHNWQRIFILERQGRLIVRRVIKKSPYFNIAALKFEVDGVPKPYGSIFFGLPMDFEMMFLFVAFLMSRNRTNTFLLMRTPVTIQCYDLNTVHNAMATAYFKY